MTLAVTGTVAIKIKITCMETFAITATVGAAASRGRQKDTTDAVMVNYKRHLVVPGESQLQKSQFRV